MPNFIPRSISPALTSIPTTSSEKTVKASRRNNPNTGTPSSSTAMLSSSASTMRHTLKKMGGLEGFKKTVAKLPSQKKLDMVMTVIELQKKYKKGTESTKTDIAAKADEQSTTPTQSDITRAQLNEKVQELKLQYPAGSSNFEKVATILMAHTKKSGKDLSRELFNSFCAQQIVKLIPGLAMFDAILGVAVKAQLDSFLRGVSTALTQTELSERDSIIKVYMTLREQFAEIDANRSPRTRKAIAGTDAEFEHGLPFQHEAALQKLLEDRIRLMSIPEDSKDISDKVTQDAVDAVVEGKQLPDVRETLEGMAVQIADNSTSPRFKGNRAQAYLFGPAGTGKTTTVEEFAQAHGLPIIRIQLGELTNPYQLENLLAEKIIESDVTNPIIIMDEAGIHLSQNPQIANVLKSLLDPDNKFLNYYGAQVDFSKATILMMGNHELREPALRSKLEQVTIPHLTPNEKRKVLDGAVKEQIDFLREKGYNKEQIGKISEEFEKHKEHLLTEDINRTPGGRVLKQVVKKVFQFLRVHERKRPDMPVDSNRLHDFIREKYANFVSPDDTYQPPPSFKMQTQMPPPSQQSFGFDGTGHGFIPSALPSSRFDDDDGEQGYVPTTY